VVNCYDSVWLEQYQELSITFLIKETSTDYWHLFGFSNYNQIKYTSVSETVATE